MSHVAESIEIDAEPRAVFAFLDEPANHATITPALDRIANVEPLENGGKELDYTYEMVGVPIAGHLTQTIHEPPTRHVFAMDSGLSGELGFRIEPSREGSRVQYHATYEIPGRLLSRVVEPVVRRYNERQLRTTLANLKSALEEPESAER